MPLSLVWKAVDVPATDYKVFIHLLSANERILAQLDSEPLNGAFPTSKWRSGDVVEDRYLLAIPKEVASGDYRIAVGLYDPKSSTRLGTAGSGDGRLMLGPFSVTSMR